MKKIIIEKKWLEQKYVNENLSSIQISELLYCDKSVILNNLHTYQISLREHPKSGIHSSNYIDGRSYKKSYCCDCGEELKKRIAKRCKPCWIKWEVGKNNPNFIDGEGRSSYPLEFNDELKESIRKRDNYECQNCGVSEEEHIIVWGKVLHVHHINYDKQNCKENNLITTCLSCNSRANFNRDYWNKFYIDLIVKKEYQI